MVIGVLLIVRGSRSRVPVQGKNVDPDNTQMLFDCYKSSPTPAGAVYRVTIKPTNLRPRQRRHPDSEEPSFTGHKRYPVGQEARKVLGIPAVILWK